MGTEKGNADAHHNKGEEKQHHQPIVPQGLDFRQPPSFHTIDDHQDGCYGQNGRYQPVDDRFPIKRFRNKPPGGPYHLHGFDDEPMAEHGQFDGIIDQNNGDKA